MTAGTPATTTVATADHPVAHPVGYLRARGARVRIVAWVLLLVLGSMAVVTVVTWQLLIRATDARMDTALRTEIEEFTALTASGRSPTDGAPFASVDQVPQTAITDNLARPNEKFLGYLDGVFRYQSRQQSPVLLAGDPGFARLAGSVPAPVEARYESAAGEVRYIAVPVTLAGDPARGVIVVAYFADQERSAADDAALLMVAAGAVTAVLAAVAAWLVAGRILRPVRDVADTARAITETDLSARITARADTRDELGALVRAVNAMLDRVEDGARAQRRFVDDAGHELRTPITIVRGHLEVVDVDDPADVRATVGLVDDELERMNRIVSVLLHQDRPHGAGHLYRRGLTARWDAVYEAVRYYPVQPPRIGGGSPHGQISPGTGSGCSPVQHNGFPRLAARLRLTSKELQGWHLPAVSGRSCRPFSHSAMDDGFRSRELGRRYRPGLPPGRSPLRSQGIKMARQEFPPGRVLITARYLRGSNSTRHPGSVHRKNARRCPVLLSVAVTMLGGESTCSHPAARRT
ncbi:HAMP domain-containing protein [Actinomycetospora lutea]|uniref:HAMP domain-containing protein n=1 Tax=Actinomycetospora lutea TaxID=663604 RepID=UPI0023661A2D|nr:HAMP domain-containing protein [Actinomycetospora lutea]MDD7940701.1 HAMP domain-containing protein [Actinomycetospora lutea]